MVKPFDTTKFSTSQVTMDAENETADAAAGKQRSIKKVLATKEQ